MSRFSKRFVIACLTVLVVALGAAAPVAQSAQSATTFSGRATALKGTINGVDLSGLLPCKPGDNPSANANFCVADTGPLAVGATSGNLEANGACYAYPNAQNCLLTPPNLTGETLSAEVLHATVVSGGNVSRAEASAANFSLNIAGQSISADLLDARAMAKCTGNGAVVQAGGETSVTINGTTYHVAADQTQTVQLVDALGFNIGYVVINEGASGPKSGNEINASALHVVIPGVIDVTVAAVHADITCAALVGCPGSNAFVTSGGFINPTGTKLHFAAAGGKSGAWGHVIYKPTGLHVKDPTAVIYDSNMWNQLVADASGFAGFQNALSRFDKSTFQGAAILSWTTASTGAPSPGEALLVDMGEPGRSDFFEIASVNTDGTLASIAGGFLAGGNIQMHGRCV